MCVIALQKIGAKKLTNESLKNCDKFNNDGYGFAYIDNGKIIVYKTMDFPSFEKQYNETHDKFNDKSPILVHFRAVSKGDTSISNCHPFIINDSVCMAHNGTFKNDVPNEYKNYSDTRYLSEVILKDVSSIVDVFNEGVQFLVSAYCGAFNKVVFLSKDCKYTIINETSGEWFEDTWFSNSHYKSYASYTNYSSCYMGKCDACNKNVDSKLLLSISLMSPTYKSFEICFDCLNKSTMLLKDFIINNNLSIDALKKSVQH